MTAKQFCYLKDLTYKGAHLRYGAELSEEVEKRIRYELSTIEWMGFPGYFLIVWDYIRAAREMGVSVGPGRGSAAGSVVAYCLKITNIDPLKYDLLFERFLNPERISLPDVDVDFDEVVANINKRDHIDQTRKESPLRKADDAIELDNSHMTIAEQDAWLMTRYKETVEKLR